MRKIALFFVLGAIMSSLLSVSAAEAAPDYNDLWDVSNGISITGSSPILNHAGGYYSDARDMFGGNYGAVGTGTTYFEDWYYYKGSQWITWHTPAPVTVGRFTLSTPDYNVPRSYSWFKLYAEGSAVPIYTFTPTGSFGGIVSATITPVTADDFRAEFGWSSVGGDWNSSTNVIELDGFAPVPEPATMTLLGLGLAGLFLRRKKKVG